MPSNGCVLALDVGNRRIGVAVASTIARIAHPFDTLENTHEIMEQLQKLVLEQQAVAVVVGLPRGLNGQHTDQTKIVEAFVANLKHHITIPIYMQDEAVTSKQAEQELQQKRHTYKKEEIDALAATYILEDFLHDNEEIKS